VSAFEQFLRPYERELVVYGRTPWPYRGYAGPLHRDLERVLYGTATVCPTVNAAACYEGYDEINERVFKVLGSGGLTVGDPVSAFGELFAADELLVASSVEEYHDHIRLLREDEAAAEAFRMAGLRAIRARHTYAARAAQVWSWMPTKSWSSTNVGKSAGVL
jgi:spore maturation protein CgeB